MCTYLYIHVCIVMYTQNAGSECRYICVHKYTCKHKYVHACIFICALLCIEETQEAAVATNVCPTVKRDVRVRNKTCTYVTRQDAYVRNGTKESCTYITRRA